MNIGIMAVDPGVKTGLVSCLLPIQVGTTWEALRAGRAVTSMTLDSKEEGRTGTGLVVGRFGWLEAGQEIAERWIEFRKREHASCGGHVYLVFEDWIARPGAGSDREGTASVWVMAAAMGFRRGLEAGYLDRCVVDGNSGGIGAIWQGASVAKGYATDKRLRGCERYVRGRPHERDAWRHVALAYANVVKELVRRQARNGQQAGVGVQWWEVVRKLNEGSTEGATR